MQYKDKERRREFERTYKRQYRQRDYVREKLAAYARSPSGLAAHHRYRDSEQGRLVHALRAARRRARKRGLPETFTTEEWLSCIAAWESRCAYCGIKPGEGLALEPDHFIPITAPDCPGTVATNVVPACRSCNGSKGNLRAEDWLVARLGADKGQAILARIADYFARCGVSKGGLLILEVLP